MSAATDAIGQLGVLLDRIGCSNAEQREQLLDHYQRVEHHIIEGERAKAAHAKPDRSALLRMAGNIAGGIAANPAITVCDPWPEDVAKLAVRIARNIMTEIDKEQGQ